MRFKDLLLLPLLLTSNNIHSQETKFAVISDTHIMAPALLKNRGDAFDNYINNDRKMLLESPDLMQQAIDGIIEENPQFILISGDLTKDGAYESHKFFINQLSQFTNQGIVVLVVPGNHDINNPHAVEFDNEEKQRVRTVSKDDFSLLYAPFGYSKAIARDSQSLSYVYQLNDSIRILALDGCKYEQNDFDKDITRHDGVLKDATLNFIREQGIDAQSQGFRMIAFMHHGTIPHWKYQNKVMPGYVIDNWKQANKLFAKYNIEAVFTGHTHAHDVIAEKHKRRTVYDISTGSTVSYPNPYRIATIKGNQLNIETRFIQDFSTYQGQEPFSLHSKEFLESGFQHIILNMLPSKLPEDVKTETAAKLTKYMIENYEGDEKLTDEHQKEIKTCAKSIKKHSRLWSKVFKAVSNSLLTDSYPEDNSLTIELSHIK